MGTVIQCRSVKSIRCVLTEGYEGNIVLIVQEMHDSNGTVTDPGAE